MSLPHSQRRSPATRVDRGRRSRSACSPSLSGCSDGADLLPGTTLRTGAGAQRRNAPLTVNGQRSTANFLRHDAAAFRTALSTRMGRARTLAEYHSQRSGEAKARRTVRRLPASELPSCIAAHASIWRSRALAPIRRTSPSAWISSPPMRIKRSISGANSAWIACVACSPSNFRGPCARMRCMSGSRVAVFGLPTLIIGVLVYHQPELILSVVDPETAAEFEEMYSDAADSIGRRRTAATIGRCSASIFATTSASRFNASRAACSPASAACSFSRSTALTAVRSAATSPSAGLSSTFYSFVATHAAFELTAIALSGAAGLRIGHSMLAPGRHTRTQALVHCRARIHRDRVRRHCDAVDRRGHRSVLVVGTLGSECGEVFGRSVLLDCRHRLSDACKDAVQVDAFAIRLRRRSNMEAADLGVRLCQSVARSVYACYLAVAAALHCHRARNLRDRDLDCRRMLLWCSKPWFDRTILFVLSRAAFGQSDVARRCVAIAATGLVEPIAQHLHDCGDCRRGARSHNPSINSKGCR